MLIKYRRAPHEVWVEMVTSCSRVAAHCDVTLRPDNEHRAIPFCARNQPFFVFFTAFIFSVKIVTSYLLSRRCTLNPHAKHLPADERRAVTVEAVVALAATQNPSEITTAAIAKHMNLTQGALFRHFPTKVAIWEAVMSWVTDCLLARIDRAADGIESPLAAMQAMFMSHVEFVIEHPGVPRMLFGELQQADLTPAKRMARTLIQRYAERIRQRIEQGKVSGEIAPDVDTQAAAILFIGTIQGLVMQSMLSGDIGRMRNDAPGVFAIYLRGMKAHK